MSIKLIFDFWFVWIKKKNQIKSLNHYKVHFETEKELKKKKKSYAQTVPQTPTKIERQSLQTFDYFYRSFC